MEPTCREKSSQQAAGAVTHPLQILPQVHEHAHACVDAVLVRLQHCVLRLRFGRQQCFVEVGFPFQLPVLVDKIHEVLGKAEVRGQFIQLGQGVELLLQLLESLRPQAHLLRLSGRFGTGRTQTGLSALRLAVLQAVGLELDLVALIQDSLQLQAMLKSTGHMEWSGAVLH